MANTCAVCYVADLNFLLPSLVSATGLRRYVKQHQADMLVFLVDGEDGLVKDLNRRLEAQNIHVMALDARAYGTIDKEKFNQTHVPYATLGRFFIEALLPSACRQIVYIDGDTWMRRDPSPLIGCTVPEGKFAAVQDMMFFRARMPTPHGRALKNYFGGLGLKNGEGYFNGGVFAVARSTWRKLSEEAFRYYLENPVACKYHDQSALNAVLGDRRLYLSLKWNFQTPYRYFGLEKSIKPVIYHFAQSPKPWMGKCMPWQEIYEDYVAATLPFADLNLPLKQWDDNGIRDHNKRMRKKFLPLNLPLVPEISSRLMGFGAMEKQAWL